MKVRPDNYKIVTCDEIYNYLKEHKDRWFTTEELATVFNDGSEEMSKKVLRLIHNGCLVINKWGHADTNHGKRRIRLCKADID